MKIIGDNFNLNTYCCCSVLTLDRAGFPRNVPLSRSARRNLIIFFDGFYQYILPPEYKIWQNGRKSILIGDLSDYQLVPDKFDIPREIRLIGEKVDWSAEPEIDSWYEFNFIIER